MRSRNLQGRKTLSAIFIACITSVGSTPPTAAQPAEAAPIELKGIALGAPESAIIAAFPSALCRETRDSTISDRICRAGDTTYAGVPAALYYFLVNGEVSSMSVTFKSSEFLGVVGAVRERYGPPTTTDESQIKTRAGVEYQQIEYKWNFDNSMIAARRFASSVTTSSITIRNHRALTEFRDRKERLQKERAKDL